MRRARRARPRREPDLGDPDRAQHHGLEGIRARGHARPRRQRRRHLLDREPRPDGRAHRRIDHRRARADAHRRRVPAHARRRVRVHPAHRRRDRRIERAVRGQPADGRDGHHRDEPARVPQLRAREQGHRVPDREDRGEARGRATASTRCRTTSRARRRRASSRRSTTSSPSSRAGRSRSCRARIPVLGTQMQSVGEVMAIGRTFCESLQKAVRSLETGRLGLNCDPAERELDALSDEELVLSAAVPTPDRIFQVEAALRRFVSVERLHEVTGIDPWFLDQILQIVEERDRLTPLANRGLDDDHAAPTGAGRSDSDSPTASSRTSGTRPRPTCARTGSPRACASRTRPSTRARPSSPRSRRITTAPTRTRTRSQPLDEAGGHHPRQRAEPHRSGRRVRLLLRARRVRAARRRVTRP